MKLKRVTSAILSMALCLSLGTVNASALEVGTETDLISENTIAAETVDISQLIGSAAAEADGLGYDIAAFGNAESSENVFEMFNCGEYAAQPTETDVDGIMPYSSNPPALSDLGIVAVSLGDEDIFTIASDEWNVIYSSDTAQTNLDLSIDATGYSYISFDVFQWGFETGGHSTLDKNSAFAIETVRNFNQFGQVSTAGDILYGFIHKYTFKIPENKTISNAEFYRVCIRSGYNVEKTAKVKITWTTPTGPAPTTPEILYNIPNPYDYATVAGLTTNMEYCGEFKVKDKDETYTSSWNPVTSEAMLFPVLDEEYTILVRYKTSTHGNPSLNCRIPVKTRAAAPAADSVAYSGIQEIFAVYDNGNGRQVEIAMGDGGEYDVVSPGYYLIDLFIDEIPTGSFNRVYVRYAATADMPASHEATLALYGRNPNTPDNVYYKNGVLYNLTSDMLFSFNGSNWYSTQYSAVNVTSFMSQTSTTLLEIKYMPTETASCSKTVEIILPALS